MFNIRLKSLRAEAGKTQNDMAEFLHVQRSTYGEYERGKIMPPYDKIKKLADYFGVSIDYLMGTTNFKTLKEKYNVTSDIVDVSATLTRLIDDLKDETAIVQIDGVDLDDESKSLLLSSIESSLKLSKILKKKG